MAAGALNCPSAESLLKAIELDPSLASAYYYLGAVEVRRGSLEDARWAYSGAADLDREGSYRQRALMTLEELGRWNI